MLKSKLSTNYLPFPYLSHHYSDRKLSWGTAAPRLYLQPTHPPKTLPGGEEINKGDWTIPPTLAEIQNKKITLSNPATNWKKIWIRKQ